MWLCHDNEVRATEAHLTAWLIARGLLPPPSFITVMIVFAPSLFFCSFFIILPLAISLSCSASPVLTFTFLYPLSCSLRLDKCCCIKSFPWNNIVCWSWTFCLPLQNYTPAINTNVLTTWLQHSFNVGHPLLIICYFDRFGTASTSAPNFSLEKCETFDFKYIKEICVEWHHSFFLSSFYPIHRGTPTRVAVMPQAQLDSDGQPLDICCQSDGTGQLAYYYYV